MTRKEKIIEILDLWSMGITETRNAVADEILALPIEVPGDDEIREQFPFYDEGIDLISNLDCQMGAEWMRDEILKRNRP